MKIKAWEEVTFLDLPKVGPITTESVQDIKKKSCRYRGSVRLATGRIIVDEECKDEKLFSRSPFLNRCVRDQWLKCGRLSFRSINMQNPLCLSPRNWVPNSILLFNPFGNFAMRSNTLLEQSCRDRCCASSQWNRKR